MPWSGYFIIRNLWTPNVAFIIAPNTLFNNLDHVKLTILRFKNLNPSHNTNKPQEMPSQVLE